MMPNNNPPSPTHAIQSQEIKGEKGSCRISRTGEKHRKQTSQTRNKIEKKQSTVEKYKEKRVEKANLR
jgi:hypothetical protein